MNGASISEGIPCGGPGGRVPLLGTPKVVLKRYIKRNVKMPWKRVSHYIGALLGNLEGIRLPGLFEKKSMPGFFCWTLRTLRFYVWGPYGTLVKGQGSPELISDYGAQRTRLQGLGASVPLGFEPNAYPAIYISI